MIELKDHEVQEVVGGKISNEVFYALTSKVLKKMKQYDTHVRYDEAVSAAIAKYQDMQKDEINYTLEELESAIDAIIAEYLK